MQAFRPAPITDRLLFIDGHSLTIDDIVDVARHRRRVAVASDAAHRIACSRKMVDVLLDLNEKVYGLTTGFGKLRDVVIPLQDTRRLQQNLIRSHASGVGPPFAEDVVRAALLLRANTLCRGNSGVRLTLVRSIVDLLNDDVYPHVPKKGSVGASGDLAPLSHLGLVLIGDPDGRVYDRAEPGPVVRQPNEDDFVALGEHYPGLEDADLAEAAGWLQFRPVRLEAKEGLAVNNGTQFMTAIAALAVYDTWFTLRLEELASALSLEANRGVRGAYDDRIHQVRPQTHQLAVARRVIGYCEGSHILDLYLNSARLQRCGIHLREANDHLLGVFREVEERGGEPPASIQQVERAIVELQEQVSRLIPARGGRADDGTIADWCSSPPHEQITRFSRLTLRCRQELGSILRTVTQATFPDGAATARLETALVEALFQLRKAVPDARIVQDDYSFRCLPQVLACAWRALEHVHEIVVIEANSATDNPLLFPPEPPGGWPATDPDSYAAWLKDPEHPERLAECRDSVIGGGNFHGEPLAIGMDYLAIAVAEAGNIAERRIAHLVDAEQSRGLPPFLVEGSGLNSGFMIPQYAAAALVSENKVLTHPASTDSIPTCANSEDHVSMGTIAARQMAEVLDNVRHVLAIELLAAWQGLRFREPLLPGRPLRAVLAVLDQVVARHEDDHVMAPDINRVHALLDDPRLLGCLGPFEVD